MNNQIFSFFYNLAHQSVFFDKTVIFFAVYFPYIVVIFALVFLLFYHKIKEIFLVFFSCVLALVVAEVLKILIQANRPFVALPNIHALFPETGYSFPSMHAVFFSALAVSIYFYHKKAGYIFMFFALLIGIARIIAGVHFPIDILCGFILGGIVACLVAFFVKNV